MTFIYYTFGVGCGDPYEGGWVKVAGEGGRSCDQTFREMYPDKAPGRLHCSGRYAEWDFLQTDMPEKGCAGGFCKAEHIQKGAVEYRMEAAVNALYAAAEPTAEPTGAADAPPRSLAEVIKAAAAAGMSYGQYVQKTEPQRREPQRREPQHKNEAEQDASAPAHRRERDRVWHSAEFKKEAVKLVISGECSVAEAARRMNIGRSTLYEWVQLYRIGRC